MKFGLRRKFRLFLAFYNLLLFRLKNKFLGFDIANLFLQKVDKVSVQLILKKNGARIGDNCDIETGLIFHNCLDYSNLIIGKNCHVGKNCFFDLQDKVKIGNNVVISMQCTFVTHIDLNKSKLSTKFTAKQDQIKIKENCYIGVNTTILKGVTIEKDSFIAAKSLINNNVPKNVIICGYPTKSIEKINE